MEIERKFVIEKAPRGLKLLYKAVINQVYILAGEGVEIRLRKYEIEMTGAEVQCKVTVKSPKDSSGLVREEQEYEIDCRQVKPIVLEGDLFPRIKKVRNYYDLSFLPGAVELVIDELETGDLIMEIEFEREEDAKNLEKTGFWRQYLSKQIEVTSDPRFKMKNLAKMSYREIKRLFKEVKG